MITYEAIDAKMLFWTQRWHKFWTRFWFIAKLRSLPLPNSIKSNQCKTPGDFASVYIYIRIWYIPVDSSQDAIVIATMSILSRHPHPTELSQLQWHFHFWSTAVNQFVSCCLIFFYPILLFLLWRCCDLSLNKWRLISKFEPSNFA